MKKLYPRQIRRNHYAGTFRKLWCPVLLILLSGLFPAQAAAQQETLFTIRKQQVPFEEIVREIEAQSDYTFMYSTKTARALGSVSLNVRDAAIHRVLEDIFNGKAYTYQIDGKVVIIGPRQTAPASVQEQLPRIVSDQVLDEAGRPLAGASVILKGTQLGVSANAEGRFEMILPDHYRGARVLQIFFVGMVIREVDFSALTEVNVSLVESEHVMEDVIVTGIFDKAPESYTGAAVKITRQELRAAGNRDILKSISNIDPGFSITASMEFGSDPNRLPDITMRGRTTMDVNVGGFKEDNYNKSKGGGADEGWFCVGGNRG
ncbi:MAG: carboxypeptidase-like regulatory domain-containing protein, partial [Rikenellaceae bacterium]|nr:carboxypeptidase-like regulatory domain-containing protein [Rikenellaceae bacterium]